MNNIWCICSKIWKEFFWPSRAFNFKYWDILLERSKTLQFTFQMLRIYLLRQGLSKWQPTSHWPLARGICWVRVACKRNGKETTRSHAWKAAVLRSTWHSFVACWKLPLERSQATVRSIRLLPTSRPRAGTVSQLRYEQRCASNGPTHAEAAKQGTGLKLLAVPVMHPVELTSHSYEVWKEMPKKPELVVWDCPLQTTEATAILFMKYNSQFLRPHLEGPSQYLHM